MFAKIFFDLDRQFCTSQFQDWQYSSRCFI